MLFLYLVFFSLNQRERLQAELEYMERLRGIKRRREVLPHRAQLDLLMGGKRMEFAERYVEPSLWWETYGVCRTLCWTFSWAGNVWSLQNGMLNLLMGGRHMEFAERYVEPSHGWETYRVCRTVCWTFSWAQMRGVSGALCSFLSWVSPPHPWIR